MLCKFEEYYKTLIFMRNSILLFALSLFFISSCVSPKIHNALVSDYEKNHKNLTQKEKEILKLSDEINADLVVMGTNGRDSLSDFILGSTAQNVIQKSHSPVLVVHEGK